MPRPCSRLSRSWVWSLLLGALWAPSAAFAAGASALIPQPARLQTCPGQLLLDASSTLSAPEDAAAAWAARVLRDAVAAQSGLELPTAPATAAATIELRRDPAIAGEEAYRLEIGPRRAIVSASGDRGLLWGVQTLRQLLPVGGAGGAPVSLPCLRIDDAPVLAYRGQMLDVARHFFPVEFIKRQLDVLSYYKINTFRWHLTDDQGWRIQIKRYPKLTQVGAWRTEADGNRHGGFYTQDQVRDVVEYARQRGIMVIPEIELPGHATAALAAYPQLACSQPPKAVQTAYGVHKDIFCAGKEEVFTFLEHVFDEVVPLFPAPYVHIGGDEVPKDRWQDCAPCQALMQREGLKDEAQLQTWFVQRIQRYLRSKGRTIIGWDEILEGGMSRDAIIEVWRGEEEGRKALANGNRIINAGQYYINSLQDKLGLKEILKRDPLADPVYRANVQQVWGAEAPLWTEYITPLNGEAMLYPRMLAFADITWNAGKPHDYAGFKQRLAAHYRWLDAQGIHYGPEEAPLVAYTLGYDRAARHWTLQATHGFDDMRSHYTLDGSAPTAASPGFARQVALKEGGRLKVAPFRGKRQAMAPREFAPTLVAHLGLGRDVALSTPSKQPYPDAAIVLSDGVRGSLSHEDDTWSGWQGVPVEATVDLRALRPVHAISAGFLQQPASWIMLPRGVEYAVSTDGRQWRTVHTYVPTGDDTRTDVARESVDFRARAPLQARYVRVRVTPYGQLKPPHLGAGHQAWLFMDEIVVE
jgi:hexosaminidase